jgi:hypothetical protein
MKEYEMGRTYYVHGRAENACNIEVGIFEFNEITW